MLTIILTILVRTPLSEARGFSLPWSGVNVRFGTSSRTPQHFGAKILGLKLLPSSTPAAAVCNIPSVIFITAT